MNIARHSRTTIRIALLALCVGIPPLDNPALAVYEEPTNCRISGIASLEGNVFETGSLAGTAESGVGTWTQVSASGIYNLVPESVTCRLDGVEIGDSQGAVLDTDYRYFLEVWDAGNGLPASHETLVASRSYSPSAWTDADYTVNGRVGFFVPAELPVTEGDAGSGWAWLTFTRFEEGDLVTCRYRGNDTGTAYAFARCTGEDDGTVPVVAGDMVSVSTLNLHVHSGCNECGTTRVELSLDLGQGEWDFFQLVFIDPVDSTLVQQWYGFIVDGDLVVESLDP